MEVMEVRNIAKSFGGLAVLQDVSFALKAGEKVALIGPNGMEFGFELSIP